MFQLSIVDHVRLSFGHVVHNYTVHARAAERAARVGTHARTTVLILMGIAVTLSGAVALGAGRPLQIAAAGVGALAFTVYAIVASLALEERMVAHHSCANRLWLLCEQYRALLTEVHDGLLEREAILKRRDDLLQQFHDIYEQASPVRGGSARYPARGGRRGLTDSQLEEFLPESLRQRPDATASAAP